MGDELRSRSALGTSRGSPLTCMVTISLTRSFSRMRQGFLRFQLIAQLFPRASAARARMTNAAKAGSARAGNGNCNEVRPSASVCAKWLSGSAGSVLDESLHLRVRHRLAAGLRRARRYPARPGPPRARIPRSAALPRCRPRGWRRFLQRENSLAQRLEDVPVLLFDAGAENGLIRDAAQRPNPHSWCCAGRPPGRCIRTSVSMKDARRHGPRSARRKPSWPICAFELKPKFIFCGKLSLAAALD